MLIADLRQQLLVLQRRHPQPRLRNADRRFQHDGVTPAARESTGVPALAVR